MAKSAKDGNDKYTAEKLIMMLRSKYGRAAGSRMASHVVLEQVPNATGFRCHSWIDAMVFSLWPSKGTTWAAYEVKVSRSDFLNEVSDHEKNAWCREYCHEFWFIAPKGVIKDASEIPEGDGWLAPSGGGLGIVRQATRRTPKIDAKIVTAMARAFDRELGNVGKTAVREYEQSNHFLHESKAAWEAVQKLCRAAGVYPATDRSTDVDAWTEVLNSTLIDHDTKKRADRHVTIIDELQDRLLKTLGYLIPIAFGLIDATDEAGSRVFENYGMTDRSAARMLTERQEEFRSKLKELVCSVAKEAK